MHFNIYLIVKTKFWNYENFVKYSITVKFLPNAVENSTKLTRQVILCKLSDCMQQVWGLNKNEELAGGKCTLLCDFMFCVRS